MGIRRGDIRIAKQNSISLSVVAVLALAIALVMVWAMGGSAGADTFTVTNLNDSGPGSLRKSIADAAAGDTITFNVTGTIILTAGQLTINKDLTIEGSGSGDLSISGNNISRVFVITSGNNVTISDVTIQDVYSFARGGGIFNEGTLTLTSSTINDNSAGIDGGGILNVPASEPRPGRLLPAGTVTLTNTFIANNPSGGDCAGAFTSLGFNLDSDGTCRLGSTGDLSNVDPRLGPLQDNGGPTFTHALLGGSPAIEAGDNSVLDPPLNLATDQRGAGFPPPLRHACGHRRLRGHTS